MTAKEISIAFQTDKTAGEYIALARLVDQYTFDVVSVYCDAPFHPSYGPLMLMAPHIRHARIGPAAVSPFRIHPIDIAANTALLADHAPGGVYVGLARGAWLADHGIAEPAAPITGIREAVVIVQNLLTGESAGINGKVFNVRDHVLSPYPLPEELPPIMIGTWGHKLAQVAGEIADEVKIGGSSNPLMAKHIQGPVSLGEKKAGRRRGEVRVVFGAVTVVDNDRDAARNLARREAARYLPVVASLDPSVEVEPGLMERIERFASLGDFDQAGDLISDELLDRFAFSGTPDDIIRQTCELFDAGVDRVEFGTPHGVNWGSGIRLLGEVVVPEIKKIYH
jgi:5,10-methylenetetrahydromethanopterin reductase